MKSWTEFHIGIIYYSGLFIALITGILTVLYLRPVKKTIKKITEKFDSLWSHGFKTSLIIAGILGAMSVSFRDCEGNYDYLLHSRYQTVMKGFEQVGTSFFYLSIIIGLWLLFFIALRLASLKKNKMSNT